MHNILVHKDMKPTEIFPGIFLSLKEERGLKNFNLLTRKEYKSVIFDIQNVRDRFDVIDPKRRCDKHKQGETVTREEEIFPNDIIYPNNLGGGNCGGCAVTAYFSKLIRTETYNIIDDREIVEQTKSEPYFVNLCKSSKCYKTY